MTIENILDGLHHPEGGLTRVCPDGLLNRQVLSLSAQPCQLSIVP